MSSGGVGMLPDIVPGGAAAPPHVHNMWLRDFMIMKSVPQDMVVKRVFSGLAGRKYPL